MGQLFAPSIADPVVQLAENNNFTEGRIYKPADQGFGKTDPRPAFTRHFDSTPAFWTAASRTLNALTGGDKVKPGKVDIEPDILRFIYGTFTGGPGRALDRSVDAAQATARGESVSPARLPLVSRFYGENDDRQKGAAYFQDLKRAEEATTRFDYFIKEGRREEATEVLKSLGGGDVARGRRAIDEFERSKKDDRVINRQLRQRAAKADDGSGEDLDAQMTALKKRKQQGHQRVLSHTAAGDDE